VRKALRAHPITRRAAADIPRHCCQKPPGGEAVGGKVRVDATASKNQTLSPEQAQKAITQLSRLFEATLLLNSTLDLAELLDRILQIARTECHADRGTVFLADSKKHELWSIVASGLDHQDLIAILKYLRSLPYIDKNGVGAMGVSHSGEMILKAAAEYDFNAGVCIEPAAHEFLQVNTGPTAPRKNNEIQYNDIEVARRNADKDAAMERVRRIHTPILIFGRETDHQQGIFKLTTEWMKEAGKDVTWESFDHPVHGYVFIYLQPDGSYKPDPMQEKAFEIFMSYFDKHLKHSSEAK
jgi:dienelactone hydrolase